MVHIYYVVVTNLSYGVNELLDSKDKKHLTIADIQTSIEGNK